MQSELRTHGLARPALKDRQEADCQERACRSLARLVVAGTDFVLVKDPAKRAVHADFCMLFDGYYDAVQHPYPTRAGRQFLAGSRPLQWLCLKLKPFMS